MEGQKERDAASARTLSKLDDVLSKLPFDDDKTVLTIAAKILVPYIFAIHPVLLQYETTVQGTLTVALLAFVAHKLIKQKTRKEDTET